MILSLLFSSPIAFFVLAGTLLVAITIHEFAHAWAADRLGDPTPRYQGRVTLDPRAHLDPLGTLALLIVGFGWGKPVEYDPYNLKDPLKDGALIALAGPASNLVLALAISLIAGLTDLTSIINPGIIETVVAINVMLAIFNLVPVFPLDGSKIVLAALPRQISYEYEQFMHQYGTYLLLILLIPWASGRSPVSLLITPVINTVVNYLSLLW
jgi:Zn-dependent protease